MTSPGTRPPAIGWDLPPFYCPLADPGRHPAADDLAQASLAWAEKHGLFRDNTERAWAEAIHNADFVSRIIPHGQADTMLLFASWNYWAWTLDDWHDSGTARGSTTSVIDHSVRALRTLEAPGASLLGDTPLAPALDDLVRRTRATFSPGHLHRVSAGLRDWLIGAAWQTAHSERRAMPTLNEFAAMRVSINGTRFSLAFSEAANNITLPPDLLYSPALQALTDAAGFIVACDNDLFSYAMDDHLDPPAQNLVNVLAHARGGTPLQALPQAVALRDRAMTLFVTLRTQLAATGDPNLHRYLDALAHYVAGCIHWMKAAPRYASPRNRHRLPVPGSRFDIDITDTPSNSTPPPPLVPSLAWWWDQVTSPAPRPPRE